MKIETKVIHAGQHPDPQTGAVMTPVYQTSTYAQKHPGVAEWEYSRTHNPTRTALQDGLAKPCRASMAQSSGSGCHACRCWCRCATNARSQAS